MSIRRRLTTVLLMSVLAAGLVAAVVVFFQARAEADALFDYQLRQIALSLRDRTFLPGELAQVLQGEDSREVVVQVWGPDGARLYSSDPGAAAPAVVRLGFDDLQGRHGAWRVFGIQQRGLTFQVAQPMAVRDELAVAAALRTLLPFLVALPVMGLFIWTFVGREFRPLDATAKAVAGRDPNALAPVDASAVPEEVRPLIESLNHLLARLAEALSRQRRFVADAAHELRTPLTALRLQLQLAERAATDEARVDAHAALREGIARSARLVEQLLALARLDPETVPLEAVEVDLLALARQSAEAQAVVAGSRGVRIVVEEGPSVAVRGDASELRMLIDNLLVNAVRHSPAEGAVTITVRRAGNEALLAVEDQGPGIPAAEREKVFARFYRGEAADGAGSGLGLAIVRRVAERHGGRIELGDASRGTGLCAQVSLPLAPP
jgi:signal transduction histidine kinase